MDILVDETSDFYPNNEYHAETVHIIVVTTTAAINMKLVIYQKDNEGSIQIDRQGFNAVSKKFASNSLSDQYDAIITTDIQHYDTPDVSKQG